MCECVAGWPPEHTINHLKTIIAMKLKVKKADPMTITFANGLTLGAHKHPNFFKSLNGFRVPTLKVGDEIEIPDEAIATSEQTGRAFVVADVTLEQLQKQEVRESIALKRKQAIAIG